MSHWLSKIYPKTIIEWLIAVVVIAILVALLLPPVRWASSGSVALPIEVVVFDMQTGLPIDGAQVTLVRAPPPTDKLDIQELSASFSTALARINERGVRSNPSGIAQIDQEFATGANHDQPVSHAHTESYWVLVSATKYGHVAMPLRYESLAMQD